MRDIKCLAECLCKMHDVPKRTEDIFILCINFYPAVEIHRRLCALPKTSTLHDYDYVTFFYVTQLEYTQGESMAGSSTAFNSLCHTRSTEHTAYSMLQRESNSRGGEAETTMERMAVVHFGTFDLPPVR